MIPSGGANQPLGARYTWPVVEVFVDFEQGIYQVDGVDVDLETIVDGYAGQIDASGLEPVATPVVVIGDFFTSLRNGLVAGCTVVVDFEIATDGSEFGELLTWHLDETVDQPYNYFSIYFSTFSGGEIFDVGAIYGDNHFADSPYETQISSITGDAARVGGRHDRNLMQRVGAAIAVQSTLVPPLPLWLAALNGDASPNLDDAPWSVHASRVKRITIGGGMWVDLATKKWQIKRIHLRPSTYDDTDVEAGLAALTVIAPEKRIAPDSFGYDSSGLESYAFGPFTLDEAPAANRLVVAIISFKKHEVIGTTTTAASVQFDGLDAECVASNGESEVWQLVVPTGTTIDEVAIVFADHREFCVCNVISFLTDSPVPYEAKAASAAADTVTLPNVAVISGGVTIGIMRVASNDASPSWGWDDPGDDVLQKDVNIDGNLISIATIIPAATSSANAMYGNEVSGTATSISVMAVSWAPVGATINDPYWSDVKLMLGFDGADAATTFTAEEASPHTLTFVGNAQLDTAQSKFGSASLLVDGTGDYVTTPDSADWEITNQPFTMEAYLRPNSTVGMDIISQWTAASRSFALEKRANGGLAFYLSTTGADTITLINVATTMTTGVWYHFRVSFDGTTYRAYVDGVQVGTSTSVTTAFNATSVLSIGAQGTGATPANGWIDEVRFTKGVCRNPGLTKFRLPAAAYPRA